MNIRERLYTITDLILDKRLSAMTVIQFDDYVSALNSFVEEFPAHEVKLKKAVETGDFDYSIECLTGVREMLIKIYADELADDCWKRVNSFDRNKPEKVEAYASFLLSTLAALSIDIQMAFFMEEENYGEPIIFDEPQQEQADERPAAATSVKPAYKQNAVKSIMAVDDDTYSLDTFKAALKDVPCKIIGATSGLSALHMLKKLKPDLFVLDIDMPKMDGIELAREIRKLEKKAPIVFITGNATREYVRQCMKAGASDFIVKPINPQEVVNRIKKFL